MRKNKGLLFIVPTYKNCQWPLSPYPKHAGEADPGPGPPGQSGRQGKGDRGHPERRPTWGISTTLTVGLYGIPRNSHQLHTGTGDSDPCQTREVQRSLGERECRCCFLSLSPSLMALVTLSLACEFPPSKARCTSFYSWSFTLSRSLMLSLPLPSSRLCLSVVTSFRGREKGGGGGRWVSSPLFFLPQLHHSFPKVLVSPSFTLYIPFTHHSMTTHHPSWGFLAKWGKQIE